jgi:hypothetical protein
MASETAPLKPFKAQYTFTFKAHDIGCAGKQQRDLLETAADLGFVLVDRAIGEIQDFGPQEKDEASYSLPGSSASSTPSSGAGGDLRGSGSESSPAPVAQMEERRICNPDVAGSNPAGGSSCDPLDQVSRVQRGEG